MIRKFLLFSLLVFLLCPKIRVFAAIECHGSGTNTYLTCSCDYDSYDDVWDCNCDSNTRYPSCGGLSCAYLVYGDDSCSGTPNSCHLNSGTSTNSTTGCWTCENSCTPTCGTYGSCSNNCGDGTQTATNSCVAGCGNTVYGTDCSRGCCNCENSCSCNASCSAPHCGGSANGQRCVGSSCPEGCSIGCDDNRHRGWNSPAADSSWTHDAPITISGWATDTNGATNGVQAVHVYRDGDPGTGTFVTSINADINSGAFSGSIPANFYASGFTGNESHTINLWAIRRDGNDCPNWRIGIRTIYLTNSAPQNSSFTPNSGDVVLDHGGPDGVGFTAIFNDSDSQAGVSGRDHDVQEARVRIGEDGSHIALITYIDDVPGGGTMFFDNGGSGITIADERITAIQGMGLVTGFDLSFSAMSAAAAGNYNIYMYSRDWAGAVDNWELMGTLGIWNGQDVAVTGVVYNITDSYPDSSCDNFDTNIGGGIIVNFDDGVNPIITDTTGGSGDYSVDLIYGDTYSYSLDGGDTYTGWLANLGEVTDSAQGCEGGSGIFIVNASGADQPNLDFGMTENLDPWIQIIGGSVTSYSSVTDIIPSTCENDRVLGGDCMPFITIADPSLGFDENGIVVGRLDIVEGPDAPEIGDPNDWRVVDTDLWQKTSRGYSYYEARLTNSLHEEEDIYSGDTNISTITGLDDGQVASGEEEIKLVDGNLTVDQNLTVVNGGAMMIIVSGNIIVEGTVDQLQGICLANGSITTNGDETSNQAFLGGTFYADIDANGSGRINNTRDRGVFNNTEPPVTFDYRPDILINLLKSSVGDRIFETTISWEEIKP